MKKKIRKIIFISLLLLIIIIAGKIMLNKQKNSEIEIQQKEIETQIVNDYNLGNYTYDNPYIIINPYGNTPLSGYMLFASEEAV